MSPKPSKPCQCENREHFDNKPGVHPFEGVKANKRVETRYGKFNACNKCASKHLKPFEKGTSQEEIESFYRGEAIF